MDLVDLFEIGECPSRHDIDPRFGTLEPTGPLATTLLGAGSLTPRGAGLCHPGSSDRLFAGALVTS